MARKAATKRTSKWLTREQQMTWRSFGFMFQTLPFYLGRTVTLVHWYDEFETGIEAEPQRVVKEIEAFVVEWRRPGRALAIMQPDLFRKLKARRIPMEALYQDPRRVLVRQP